MRIHQADECASALWCRFYMLEEVRENGSQRGPERPARPQCYIWNTELEGPESVS